MLKGLRKRLAIIFTLFTGGVLTAALAVAFYQSATQTLANREMWFSGTVDRVVSTVMNNAVSGEQTGVYADPYIICVKENGRVSQDFLAEITENTAVPATPVSDEERLAMFDQAKTIANEKGLTNWILEGYQVFSVASASVGVVAEDNISFDVTVPAEAEMYTESPAIMGEGMMALTIGPMLGTEGVFEMDHAGTQYRATYGSWEIAPSPILQPVVYEFAIMENLAAQNRQLLLDGLWYLLLWLAGLLLLFVANWFLARLVLRPTADGLRRQTEFVAAASHELRSPLAVICSSLSAADTAADDEQAVRFRQTAADEAQRMSHLVDDLLLLAGGDAGSWQLQKAPVDLDTLLISTAERYMPLAREKQVRLSLALPDETLPRVQGDAERLRQILAVLLDNALQYAPQDTAITLSARAHKGKVSIAVADCGQGVPDDEKEKVFERFYRADKSRHSKAHFGLGLSVAKELAELHRGRLSITDSSNGGATFTLTLPVS